MPKENVTSALASMANICRDTVMGDKDSAKPMQEKTVLFALRAMTGAIILYDHIAELGRTFPYLVLIFFFSSVSFFLGAFHKKSPIRVRDCITLLKTHELKPTGLVNALRFTTVHLNDPDTPDIIKQMLAQ